MWFIHATRDILTTSLWYTSTALWLAVATGYSWTSSKSVWGSVSSNVDGTTSGSKPYLTSTLVHWRSNYTKAIILHTNVRRISFRRGLLEANMTFLPTRALIDGVFSAWASTQLCLGSSILLDLKKFILMRWLVVDDRWNGKLWRRCPGPELVNELLYWDAESCYWLCYQTSTLIVTY